MKAYMLTTKDNPFSPVTQFDAWYNYDLRLGHDCCGLLDRVANTSDALSENETQWEINRAIDEIIALDFNDIYRRVEIPQEYLDRRKRLQESLIPDDID